MKYVLVLLIICTITLSHAQIVDIPDANFKKALLEHDPVIDTNGDGEIQVSEANNYIGELSLWNKRISDLSGIEYFTALEVLKCHENDLRVLDVSKNTTLTELSCYRNDLTELDVSNNTALIRLECSSNYLTVLDVSKNTVLTYLECSFNPLTELDVTKNTALIRLDCYNIDLTVLNVSKNTVLTYLECSFNPLTELDVTKNTALIHLECSFNDLTVLDVSKNTALTYLSCSSNSLTELDVSNNKVLNSLTCFHNTLIELNLSNNTLLTELNCSSNTLIELDVSNNIALIELECSRNKNLSYVNLRNGNNWNITLGFWFGFGNLPKLKTVCVDDIHSELVTWINGDVGHPVSYTEDCSQSIENTNQVIGALTLDINSNGCDSLDIPIENAMVVTTDGLDSIATFTQSDGAYRLYTSEGNFSTYVASIFEYYDTDPKLASSSFEGIGNIDTIDFCIEANQEVNDVNISLIPIGQTRPGFDVRYQLVYRNVGTMVLAGEITLDFDNTKLIFIDSSPEGNSVMENSINFSYSALKPFEKRIINLNFKVFAPPTVTINDTLHFEAWINPVEEDISMDDNHFVLHQQLVGSYDPNDITCLQGDEILLEQADEYLHYVIRFQNTGTANAVNIVVANELDQHLDWRTFQLESTSHENEISIKNGQELEFRFTAIFLPDSTMNEMDSHGFIAYKIKPKPSVQAEDIFNSQAQIYFDYNEPVATNTATTEIVIPTSVTDIHSLDFSIFPNPIKDILTIRSETRIGKIDIYDSLGHLILRGSNTNAINLSSISAGIYFIKVEDSDGAMGVRKLIKE